VIVQLTRTEPNHVHTKGFQVVKLAHDAWYTEASFHQDLRCGPFAKTPLGLADGPTVMVDENLGFGCRLTERTARLFEGLN